MNRSAVISKNKKYRYELSRIWSESPKITFIMLNPSLGNETYDDKTIKINWHLLCTSAAEDFRMIIVDESNLDFSDKLMTSLKGRGVECALFSPEGDSFSTGNEKIYISFI